MADVKMKSIDATSSIPYASITPYYSDKSLTKSVMYKGLYRAMCAFCLT